MVDLCIPALLANSYCDHFFAFNSSVIRFLKSKYTHLLLCVCIRKMSTLSSHLVHKRVLIAKNNQLMGYCKKAIESNYVPKKEEEMLASAIKRYATMLLVFVRRGSNEKRD